jgi:hypothetical protein
MSLEAPCGFDRGSYGPSIGASQRTETRSNIRAIRHLDEFVAGNARAIRHRVHLFPADLTVRLMVIVEDGFVVRNFIQRPAVGALKCLSHLTNIPWLRSRLLDGPGSARRS